MEIIQVRNVKKNFKSYNASTAKTFLQRLVRSKTVKTVLNNVSFSVKKGEIAALLGKNGSGKSTMLKILSGILYPESGTVIVNGMQPWRDRIRYAQTIGVVFSQHSNLYSDLPPLDTFKYMQHLYQIPMRDYAKRLEHLIKVLELEDVYTKQTRLLSFGERMKCNFVTATLHAPSVVFLDEATVGIDLTSKFALRRAVMDMRKEFGTTFIMATHLVDDIEELAEHIIFMDGGRVIFDGPRSGFNATLGNKKHLELFFNKRVSINPAKYGKLLEKGLDYLTLEIDMDRMNGAELQRLVNGKQIIDYNLYEPELEYILQKFYAKLKRKREGNVRND
jgi:ABC-2 type transport system ATP-binding protein